MEQAPCGHTKLSVLESGTATTRHLRMAAGDWFHDSEFGDYTGAVEIECGECGRRWRYGPKAKRPAWVKRLVTEATLPTDEG